MAIETVSEPTDSFKKPLLTALLYVAVVLLSLAAYGYQPASSNIYNQLPAVISLLNPELYASDFYVQEMVQFNPRYYYYQLIVLGVKLGLSLPVACFLLYLAAFSSFLIGLYALGKQFSQSNIVATALAFLGLAALSNGRIGFADLFRADPLPATLAMGIEVWGFYFCFRQQWVLGYFLFGLTCLMQFLVGALPGVLMAIPLIKSQRPYPIRRIFFAFLLLGSMACLVYVPMRLLGNTSSGAIDSATFVHLYGNIRHPHHLVFSTFGFLGSRGWLNFITFTLGGLFCIASTQSLDRSIKLRLHAVICMTLVLLTVNFLFVEVYPLDTVAKLQFVRATPFSQLMILLGVSVLIEERCRQNDCLPAFLLLLAPTLKGAGGLFFIIGFSLWLDRRGRRDEGDFDQVVCFWGLFSGLLIACSFQMYWLAILLAISGVACYRLGERQKLPRMLKTTWLQYLSLGLLFLMLVIEFSIVGLPIGLMFVLWRASRKSRIQAKWLFIAALILFALSTILHYHYNFFLAVAIALPLIADKLPSVRWQRLYYVGISGALLFCLILLPFGGLSHAAGSFLGPRVSLDFVPDKDEIAIAALGQAFREKSPADALVLVPPQEETFRFYAQRSLVFTFKGFPFTDAGIQTWKERLETMMGVDNILDVQDFSRWDLDPIYRDLSSADILAIAQKYGAGYIMTRLDWHPELTGRIVAQEQEWIIRRAN